jgi:cysteine desulfurase family protein (TIGR01976 family)
VVDLDDVRRRFPALHRIHEGQRVAYFDAPGGTQVPQAVVDAVSDYLLHHNANTHWAYATSVETDAALRAARSAFGDFLNGSPDEIAFGPNMTTLTFHLGRALGRRWGSGDEIVVTELDHHANVDPWRALEKERGVVVRKVAMRPETGALDWGDLERSITNRTRLVAVGAASNALGTITDVAAVTALAHAQGALCFVDAVHLAPHGLVDVRRMGCDLLACSAYKFYGPHVGILWGRRELIGGLDVPKLEPAPDHAPDRLETGTQNHEGIVGAAAAVDFLASLGAGASRRAALESGFAWLHERGRVLTLRLWEGLAATPGVTLFGPPPSAPRTPTVSFVLEGRSSRQVAEHLARRAVFVSHGDFYALTVARRLGHEQDGLVRVGCSCFTTEEEVDRVLAGVREIAGR